MWTTPKYNITERSTEDSLSLYDERETSIFAIGGGWKIKGGSISYQSPVKLCLGAKQTRNVDGIDLVSK